MENMIDLTPIYDLIPALLPFESLKLRFMQQAFLGLLILAPMAATMGIQVVNFRMAFFSDAISHSVFAGVAIGLILSINPYLSTPLLGLIIGLGIMALQRRSNLSMDTIIGVFFSAIVAFGLAIVSREQSIARNLQSFLYGDILTITEENIFLLLILFVCLTLFQIAGYNRMLYIGLHPILAEAHRVKVALYQYLFAALLSIVVVFSVWAVGVLLVTALLIVPAAAARNFAKSAASIFWWSLLISISSALSGLIISAQDWAQTATGATVVLVSCVWFMASLIVNSLLRRQ
jgi:zinc transport system permease protein